MRPKSIRSVRLHQLEPQRQHPLYWVLSELYGMDDRSISTLGLIDYQALRRRLHDGHEVPAALVARLRNLAMRVADEIARRSVEAGVLWELPAKVPVAAHRRGVHELARAIVDLYDPRHQASLDVERTALGQLILAELGTRGAPADVVVANLRHHARSGVIRRAASRHGVVERRGDDGRPFWIPPPNAAAPAAPEHPPRPPKSPRATLLYDKLNIMLGRAPDMALPVEEIMARLAPHRFSRTLIYRAATDMRLVRQTTGFGPTKRTVWMMPRSKTPVVDPVDPVAPTCPECGERHHDRAPCP